MDRVTLRTLALKSTMNFGKYADYTVQQVLDQNPIDGRKYLIWVYYNSSNISFNIEILSILGITTDNLIKKPGKVKEDKIFYFFLRNSKYSGHSTERERTLILANHNMAKKIIRSRIVNNNFTSTNKKTLQQKNQGHK